MFRFRFRLITLFAIMSLVAVSAAAYGMYQRAVERAMVAERRACTQIAGKGGYVLLYDEGAFITFMDPNTPRMGLCGTGLRGVYGPQGSPLAFGDADIAIFEDVRKIVGLDLKATSVTSTAVNKFRQSHPDSRIEF
jgi:hypothetical protein